MVKLVDVPHELRMRLRDRIEATGCEVESYDDDCFLVRVPRLWLAVREALEVMGFAWVERWYFPLGSDCNWAKATMKHDGGYPQSFGFWMYAWVRMPSNV